MASPTSLIDLLIEGGANGRRFIETDPALASGPAVNRQTDPATSEAKPTTGVNRREEIATTLEISETTGGAAQSVAAQSVSVLSQSHLSKAGPLGQEDPAVASSVPGSQPIAPDPNKPPSSPEHDDGAPDGTPLPGLAGLRTISAAGTTTPTASATPLPLGSSVDLGRTFFLHSNPTATKTIFLDFDGGITSGTAWNTNFNGGQAITTTAYDFDGNLNAFSNAELERIQFIW